MTKKIISTVFASLLLLSTSATAQVQTSSLPVKCDQTQCEFEGLDLTDVQKNQLKALKMKRLEQMKERKDSLKAERKLEKEKIKGDRRTLKEEREAERRQYLNEVKEIIGPDNYIIFLENQFVQAETRGNRNPNFGPGQPGQHGKMIKAKKGEGTKFEKCRKDDKQKCSEGKKARK